MLHRRVCDCVIIGAGHNGLVAAAYLAKSGLDVLVLERRHTVGGAVCTEEIFPGCRVSTCSYVVHMLQDRIYEDLRLHEQGLELTRLNPKSFLPFADGSKIVRYSDPDRYIVELARFSAADAARYPEWADFWRSASGILNRFCLDPEPPTVTELERQLEGTADGELLRALRRRSPRDLITEFFETPAVRLAALLELGAPVFSLDEPGPLLAGAYMQTGRHTTYSGLPTGGMGAVSTAMALAAEAAGARIRTGAGVDRILTQQGRAVGVRLHDGQEVRARVILSNVNPKLTLGSLLPLPDAPSAAVEEVQSMDSAWASMKFHAHVDELPDLTRWLGRDHDEGMLAFFDICPTIEYYEEAVVSAIAGIPAERPMGPVQIPSVLDPTLVPQAGHHVVSMNVRQMPVAPKGTTWAAIRDETAQRIVSTITEYAPNFESSILDWVLYTPADLESRLGMLDGMVHHLTHRAHQMLGDRGFGNGGYRTPVEGLYLCGPGAHPGGEVTGAPGHNAAQVVLSDVGAPMAEVA